MRVISVGAKLLHQDEKEKQLLPSRTLGKKLWPAEKHQMIVKAFEIRDRHTFIQTPAVTMVPTGEEYEEERYLLARAGYTLEPACVMLCRMDAYGANRNASYDPYAWADRTLTVAHQHITKEFDNLKSGDVIDVEFILGETTTPKLSERHGPFGDENH